MKYSSLLAGAATAVALCSIGGGALAATIKYDLTIEGSGNFVDGSTPISSFSDLTVQTIVDADTTTLFEFPSIARVIQETAGSVTYSGITRALTDGDSGSSFVSYEGANSGVVGYGNFKGGPHTGPFVLYSAVYSSALDGYDLVSAIGPVSVLPVDKALGDPFEYEADTGIPNMYIDFYNVTNATFSASIPEPKTWAIMLMGFGGLGAAMRSHRRLAAASA